MDSYSKIKSDTLKAILNTGSSEFTYKIRERGYGYDYDCTAILNAIIEALILNKQLDDSDWKSKWLYYDEEKANTRDLLRENLKKSKMDLFASKIEKIPSTSSIVGYHNIYYFNKLDMSKMLTSIFGTGESKL